MRPASVIFSPDHEGDERDDEDSEGFELNSSDSDFFEVEDGPGISNGKTIRRSSSRPAGMMGQGASSPSHSNSALSQFLNQMREEIEVVEGNSTGVDDSDEDDEVAQAMQVGASPQLVAPVLLASAEDDGNNTSS